MSPVYEGGLPLPASADAWAGRSDAELLAVAAAGSGDAFTELVKRFGHDVWSFCFRWCRDAHAVQDLAQEVWIKVWRAAGGYQGQAQVRTWLFTIVRRTAIDAARRAAREPVLPYAAVPEAEWTAVPGPESGFAERDRLDRALALIPYDHRVAVILRHDLEMSYAEIARVCGAPEATIRSRVARGRVALSRLLRQGADPGSK